jgi:predicted DNA-binding transcriptional regulator AlpA
MRFLSYPQLEPEKGLRGHPTTIWRKEKDGRFPKRSRFGPILYGWPEPIIDAYGKAIATGHSEKEATAIAERLRAEMTEATAA